jgi:hypothetical protein
VPQKKNIADVDIQDSIFCKYAVLTSVVCLTLGHISVRLSTYENIILENLCVG